MKLEELTTLKISSAQYEESSTRSKLSFFLACRFLLDSKKHGAVLHDAPNAGVVKLVDALDSKSSGPCARVGSIPTSGTSNFNGLSLNGLTRFFL